jgi:Domain of unknown function (DUF397)
MIPHTDTAALAWRKSSHSTGGNQCIEVTTLPDGHVAVRDSKNPRAGAHVFSRATWEDFTRAVRDAPA